MSYTAVVRRKKGPAAKMKAFRASDIREAGEIVRAKHDLYGDDPHDGFTITHSLPTSAKTEGN